MEFDNKVLVVTGAASGMGFLTAKCFCKQGGRATLVDINKEALDKCVEEIKSDGGEAIGVVCDVRDYKQVENVCETAFNTFGSIDVLVNCAGGASTRILKTYGEFHEIPIEVFDWGLDVNLKGAFYFCHVAMRYMVKQKSGVIVNLGSITGEEGGGTNVDYAAAKSALMNGVVKSLAQAGAKYNIRSVCVAPGPVLTRAAMANMKTLCGRAAEPQEIVDMILYMASDKASFVNGTTVLIDGGRNVMFNKT